MSAGVFLRWMVAATLAFGLLARVGAAAPQVECGREISARDVLVLDVEHIRNRPQMAQDYIAERAGKFRLLATSIEEIRTRSRPSRNPGAVTRQARKLGAKYGCDLVIVLKTGPYLGRQRSTKARIKDHGYAFVVMGQRISGFEAHP